MGKGFEVSLVTQRPASESDTPQDFEGGVVGKGQSQAGCAPHPSLQGTEGAAERFSPLSAGALSCALGALKTSMGICFPLLRCVHLRS